VLKLKIAISGQAFEFEGEAPFADVFKLAGDFLHAVLNTDVGELRESIGKLDKERAAQAAAVASQPK
jgi:hypothetical protein